MEFGYIVGCFKYMRELEETTWFCSACQSVIFAILLSLKLSDGIFLIGMSCQIVAWPVSCAPKNTHV